VAIKYEFVEKLYICSVEKEIKLNLNPQIMKRSLTIFAILVILGLSSAFAQNIQGLEYQKHMSITNPVADFLNLSNPKSLVDIVDSVYTWGWDTLTNGWNAHPSDKIVQIVYNTYNEQTSEIWKMWRGSKWENYWQVTYTYNSNNDMTNQTYQVWDSTSSTWGNDMEFIYEYNSSNLLTSDTDKYWLSGAWHNEMAESYTYTGSNMTGSLVQEWTGTWSNELKDVYSYTGSALTSDLQSIWSGSSWANYYQTTYTNNVNNKPISGIKDKWNGTSWVEYEQLFYTYDANNFIKTQVAKTWNSSVTKITIGDSLYYYDHAATGINELTSQNENVVTYPNPVANSLTIVASQKATINIINTKGQLVETALINSYITNIDVSNLPSGLYLMDVKTEKGIEAKKFIKE
jgi:hypothetical protein